MRALLAIGLLAVALALVMATANWSDGATQRADITAQADIAIASRQAEAQMHAADVQAEAQMHAADATTQRTAIVAGVLPVVLLLVISGGVLLMVVWFRGRAHLARTQAMLLHGGQPVALLPPPGVRRLAEQRGAVPALVDGQWLLLRDGEPVARCRQLPAPDGR